MGIEIVVEGERGDKVAAVEDPTNILHRILPSKEDTTYRCLNRVDWYGHTTFNRYQIAEVREELKRLSKLTRDPEELALIDEIAALAERCESEPHLYLKFYGD